jgi:hypothetical protein
MEREDPQWVTVTPANETTAYIVQKCMSVSLVMARIVMIATTINVTTATKRFVQSALREAMIAINVKIAM